MRRHFDKFPAVAVLAVLLSGATVPAGAFEMFGIRIFGGEEAPDVVGEPQPYEVTFETIGDEREVGNAIRGASRLWADRGEPASGSAGLISKAKSDYRRILAALYDEGYYGGVIHILIDGREADGLAPDTELPDPVDVAVTVEPGPQFVFDDMRIVNRAPPATDRDDEVPQPQEEGFAPGEIARAGAVLRAERLATSAWREQGHAKAEIAGREVTADHRARSVDVAIAVEPGPRAVYGPTSIQGTTRMNPEFVRYMTDLSPGGEFDPDDVENARDRLARLDVFQSLTVREADEIVRGGLLPIEVDVQERPPRRIGVGGTYSTVDGLGLEAFWLHRNLFGQAERLRFDAKVGGIGDTIDYEEFDYSAGVTYTRPGAFTPDTDMIAGLSGKRDVLDAYTETSVTARLGLTHRFDDEFSGEIFGEAKYGEFEDDLGTRSFTTFGIPAKLTYDTRDNSADATQGFFLEGTVEPFYEFEFGNPAASATLEGRVYYGLDAEDRLVLAGRLKIGSIVGPDIAEIPPDRLFFAGGGGSVRGYEYRSIGVREGGVLTGGRSLVEGSAEVRADVTQSIGLVGFADFGYVGTDSFPGFSEDLKLGVGAGIRYQTGLGPIRLDVATPLDPGPGDPDVALYVGIGQAF